MSRWYASLFTHSLKINNIKLNENQSVYIINGRLILLGCYNIDFYERFYKLAKTYYKGSIYNFSHIVSSFEDMENIDQQEFHNTVIQNYALDLTNFKKLYFHVYRNVLYVVSEVEDEYSLDYLLDLSKLIFENEEDVDSVQCCICVNGKWFV